MATRLKETDVVIIGAGGAGLRAAIAVAEADPSRAVALVSKVYPMRSHTVAAEGGAAGVIKDNDSLDYHFHDTVAGGDWLCDQDAVYDPLDSNDRLLLGMRGAMSEYELVTLRNRMLRGSRNKAERGELFLAVPVGYLKLSSEEIIQEPDEQARDMVQLVFDKFEELGSACAVFRYFVANQLQLGFRPQRAGRIGELEWRLPSLQFIVRMLHHPIYAGAYAYGLHRAGTKNPATGRTEGGKWFVPPEEIRVLLRDRLPA